ncbi:MAG: YidC/Oxa1 family membrane protein insertase [Acidimicrobiia bacterium]
MFDWLFEAIAKTLSFFYELIPNYAIAIALLTVTIMIVTTPFTLKGTRSMIQLQILQPEMRRLQVKYKDDRAKLNEELMAFYKENNLNPLGGCLPMLLQAPIFLVLYRVISGLTNRVDGVFEPRYLDDGSALNVALSGAREMMSFGVDLAESAGDSLADGFVHGLPHLVLVAIVAVTSYFQQRQIQSRNPNAEIPPQQKMLMRIFPAMFVFISFFAPSAIVVYFVVSNLFRIGIQAYITRSLYHGENSLGARAQAAAAEARKINKDSGQRSEVLPRLSKADREERARAAAERRAAKDVEGDDEDDDARSNGSGGAPPPTRRTSGAAQNRSKKKKRRR